MNADNNSRRSSSRTLVRQGLDAWFATRGWKPFKFQRDVWKAIADGNSGLLHATTGAGKTYAVWLGALMSFVAIAPVIRANSAINKIAKTKLPPAPPLTVLWITPMRALAADTLRALQLPLEVLQAGVADEGPRLHTWTAGARSGDTAAAERSAQNARLPTVLVTTPESLSLMLSRADAHAVLGSVKMVVVDEWHELLGNKRGVQVQLALARLRRWTPTLPTACSSLPSEKALRLGPDPLTSSGRAKAKAACAAATGDEEEAALAPCNLLSKSRRATKSSLQIWGMSATLGNLQEAMHTLLGHDDGVLVQGQVPKKLLIDSLLPGRVERFPWGGHLGLSMLPQVIEEVASSSTTLVFTNTRSQAEIWY